MFCVLFRLIRVPKYVERLSAQQDMTYLLSPFRVVHYGKESVASGHCSTVMELQNAKVLQVSAVQTSLFDLNQWSGLQ
jgi:hypothetical protein